MFTFQSWHEIYYDYALSEVKNLYTISYDINKHVPNKNNECRHNTRNNNKNREHNKNKMKTRSFYFEVYLPVRNPVSSFDRSNIIFNFSSTRLLLLLDDLRRQLGGTAWKSHDVYNKSFTVRNKYKSTVRNKVVDGKGILSETRSVFKKTKTYWIVLVEYEIRSPERTTITEAFFVDARVRGSAKRKKSIENDSDRLKQYSRYRETRV